MHTMKKLLFPATLLMASLIIIVACSKTKDAAVPEISDAVKAKVAALGFSASDIQKHPDGYLVEGDIVLTENDLNNGHPDKMLLRVANEEQYRTTNLVSSLPRNITIRVSSTLPSSYVTALNNAISRYNAQGLRITMSRVTSGGNIVITAAPSGAGYLASSGFPSGGNPYGQVLVNRSYLDTWNSNTVTSILAHEIGHAIGFRHTDYMSREYSCGGGHVNEGASTVGAILIPGTPSGPSAGSWMLACIGNGVNRPFTSSDVTALNYVY
jgi:Zn-dependent protease with chaperone function